jgi:hypothetical protein
MESVGVCVAEEKAEIFERYKEKNIAVYILSDNCPCFSTCEVLVNYREKRGKCRGYAQSYPHYPQKYLQKTGRVSPVLISFDDIPFEINTMSALQTLGLDKHFFDEIDALVKRSNLMGRPRAVVRILETGPWDEKSVQVGGTNVESRLASSLLRDAGAVYAYVVTCGVELERLMNETADPVEKMWQAQLNQEALRQAQRRTLKAVEGLAGAENLCSINPGSHPDWPLAAQRQLFALIGRAEECTGVELNESLLMLPTKSVSGIWFQSRQGYENCRICERAGCEGRRAAFDRQMHGEIFSMEV